MNYKLYCCDDNFFMKIKLFITKKTVQLLVLSCCHVHYELACRLFNSENIVKPSEAYQFKILSLW